jgi:LL-diaminopimelate aminotransferase
MLHVNENYARIKPTYLFAEIAHRVAAHQAAHPQARIIRLGIGDVTEPLCPAVI